jgi:hypothetical protein
MSYRPITSASVVDASEFESVAIVLDTKLVDDDLIPHSLSHSLPTCSTPHPSDSGSPFVSSPRTAC